MYIRMSVAIPVKDIPDRPSAAADLAASARLVMASSSHDEPMAPPNIEERRNEEQTALRTAFREARRKWLEVMLDQDFVKGMDPEQRETYLHFAMQEAMGLTSLHSTEARMIHGLSKKEWDRHVAKRDRPSNDAA